MASASSRSERVETGRDLSLQLDRRGDATRALLLSGDEAEAEQVAAGRIEGFGFTATDLRDLVGGGRRQQVGQPLATGRDLLFADGRLPHSPSDAQGDPIGRHETQR